MACDILFPMSLMKKFQIMMKMIIKIMVMTALTLSSKPEMPIPEAAAVPAKPMKWPDLVVMMMMMITSMMMMMMTMAIMMMMMMARTL